MPDLTERSQPGSQEITLSAIVPIVERYDDIRTVFDLYSNALAECDVPFEIVYVLDGEFPDARRELQSLQASHPELRLVIMARSFGEATTISAGAENARGEWVLTLPAYLQVDPTAIPDLFAARMSGDMVIASRDDAGSSAYNRLQMRVFNRIAGAIGRLNVADIACNVRLFRRSILQEVELYGDFHRFLPLLVHSQGFTVAEISAPQAEQNKRRRIYAPGLYVRRLLDLLAIYFLLRFTKKPFRFFGLIGTLMLLIGGGVMAWIATERMFFGQDLADRPMLVLASLLLVFGVQVISVGLLGEIVIFSHAKQVKEYSVAKVVESRPDQ